MMLSATRTLLLRSLHTNASRQRGAPWLAASASFTAHENGTQRFSLEPGGFLHVTCTQPGTTVRVINGEEDAVVLQSDPPQSFTGYALPGGRVIGAKSFHPPDYTAIRPYNPAPKPVQTSPGL